LILITCLWGRTAVFANVMEPALLVQRIVLTAAVIYREHPVWHSRERFRSKLAQPLISKAAQLTIRQDRMSVMPISIVTAILSVLASVPLLRVIPQYRTGPISTSTGSILLMSQTTKKISAIVVKIPVRPGRNGSSAQ
jgi:hypothetical protein